MYLVVAGATDDVIPDSSALRDHAVSVYVSELGSATLAPSDWPELPAVSAGEVAEFPESGTRGARLRHGEGCSLGREHALLFTGPEPIAACAFSESWLDEARGDEVVLLSIVKYASYEALAAHLTGEAAAAAAILQHWLVAKNPQTAPVLVNRLLLRSGVPRAIKWTRWQSADLFCYIGDDHKFRICRVQLSADPSQIRHSEIFVAPGDDGYTDFDQIKFGEAALRVALSTAAGSVVILDLTMSADGLMMVSIRGRAEHFLHPSGIFTVRFLQNMAGYIVVTGCGNGRIRTHDLRLPGAGQLLTVANNSRPISSLQVAGDRGILAATQIDGLTISLSSGELVRHHFSRALPTPDNPEPPDYWSQIIAPAFRSAEYCKVFEAQATQCALARDRIGFAFDSGIALHGHLQVVDLRGYHACSLFAWSFVPAAGLTLPGCLKEATEASADQKPLVPRVENEDVEPKELLRSSAALLTTALLEADRRARESGVHILACEFYAFERALKKFFRLPPDKALSLDRADDMVTLSINVLAAHSDWQIFAHGTRLGIVHLYRPGGP